MHVLKDIVGNSQGGDFQKKVMGVRILRVPKFCVNIKLLYLDPTYFRLYVRLTATEKYTIFDLS